MSSAVEPGNGKADAVIDEFLQELEEGHHGVAFLAQKEEDHQPSDGPHVGEEAAAEEGSRLGRGHAEQAGPRRCGSTPEDVAEGPDEGEKGDFRLPDLHDPEGADEGQRSKTQQHEALQKGPDSAEPFIGAEEALFEKTADSVPEQQARGDKGE
ncbi:hypothetical protein SDC9_174655 [bioreactor metagenome]|uniref:Uncharacterized protein n=1 Tax=bioreactor metagenome TaxID=1076179 RepID=A0A645GJZ7_9ZZZZ